MKKNDAYHDVFATLATIKMGIELLQDAKTLPEHKYYEQEIEHRIKTFCKNWNILKACSFQNEPDFEENEDIVFNGKDIHE